MNDPYATHQPFLKKLLALDNPNNLPILELGSGFGSTPILHEHCSQAKIELKTLDNNIEWLSKMKDLHPENEHHKYIEVLDWYMSLSELLNQKYFLVFIDQAPWEARTLSLQLFKNISEYVLIHDCDYFPTNKIWGNVISPILGPDNPGSRDYSDQFKNYKEVFPEQWACPTGPPTLIGSQFHLVDFI